jgi:ATP-dependent Clp protease ATP-binding subunit ClpB
MQIDSKPDEMDKLERRIIQLKLEEQALSKETDTASLKRLEVIEIEREQLEQKFGDLDKIWRAEKNAMQGTQFIKGELEQAKLDLEIARRASDLSRMSELQYGRIPELELKLEQASESDIMETQLIKNKVTENEIADVLSRWTGIPVSKMLDSEKDKLVSMEDSIGKRVIGQREAVVAVSNAIRRSRAGLSDPDKPTGSFLFLGPTGVGKTELCKSLANFLFDTEDAMVRIDMSEFMEKHSVSRLVGAPPGYVGYEEGGYLTEAVRRKPYSVILLDEVEKAHPDVFNILLQVLDDGRLTDGQGRTVDFKNTLIIMTSNLGSDIIQGHTDDSTYEEMKKQVMVEVSAHFRPEFINRVDDIVVFHSLGREEIKSIAKIQLLGLRQRLQEMGLKLEISGAALDVIADAGFDPVYGARPLKRAIQTQIENPLAETLLSDKLVDKDVVRIDVVDGVLVIA